MVSYAKKMPKKCQNLHGKFPIYDMLLGRSCGGSDHIYIILYIYIYILWLKHVKTMSFAPSPGHHHFYRRYV